MLGKEQVATLCQAVIPFMSGTVRVSTKPFPNEKISDNISNAIDDLLTELGKSPVEFREKKPCVFFEFPGMSTEASLLLWTLAGGLNQDGVPGWGSGQAKHREHPGGSEPSESDDESGEASTPDKSRGRKKEPLRALRRASGQLQNPEDSKLYRP